APSRSTRPPAPSKGTHGRTARQCRLVLRKLHALPPVHVGEPPPLPASAIHYRRSSRRLRDPRPRPLGLGHPSFLFSRNTPGEAVTWEEISRVLGTSSKPGAYC